MSCLHRQLILNHPRSLCLSAARNRKRALGEPVGNGFSRNDAPHFIASQMILPMMQTWEVAQWSATISNRVAE